MNKDEYKLWELTNNITQTHNPEEKKELEKQRNKILEKLKVKQ